MSENAQATPTAESQVPGQSPSDLPADTMAALAGLLAEDGIKLNAPAAAPPAKPTATPPAPAPAAKPTAPAVSTAPAAPAELTPEQKDWLARRAAAPNETEANALDATAPQFSDEQWSLAEKTISETPAVTEAAAPSAEDQLKAAQTEAAQRKAELDALAKRLADTEAALTQAQIAPQPVTNLHPLMTADAAQLDQAEAKAAYMKKWCLARWDGTPATEAQGDQPAQPAYSAEQIRSAYATAEEQLTQVIPAARRSLGEHIAANVAARQIYPELFDTKTAYHQNTQAILRHLPGLRTALPNVNIIMGDAVVGETLRTVFTAAQRSADADAAAAALIKIVPQLATFLPALTAKTTARPGMRLPAKPVVPLARPSSGAGKMGRPGKSAAPAPTFKDFAKVAGTPAENDALTELIRSQMGNIPVIDPKTES